MKTIQQIQVLTVQVCQSEVGTGPRVTISTLNEASAAYLKFLNDNGLGARGGGFCLIRQGTKVVAYVSPNGKVWAGDPRKSDRVGEEPLFVPNYEKLSELL